MILDIIFIVFIVVFAIVGFFSGLFKTFVSFFGWFISFTLSFLCAKALANAFLSANTAEWLIGDGSIFDKVYAILPDALKEISMDAIRAAIAEGLSVEQINAAIAAQTEGLLVFLTSIIQQAVCKPMYLNSSLTNVAQVLALELTYHLYVIIVGVIFFLLLRIIVMGVSIVFKQKGKSGKERDVLKLPLRVGGLALGALRGFAYGCVLLLLSGYLSGIFTFMQEQVDSSKLSAPITTWVSDTTGQMLSDDLEENQSYMLVLDELENRIAEERAAE